MERLEEKSSFRFDDAEQTQVFAEHALGGLAEETQLMIDKVTLRMGDDQLPRKQRRALKKAERFLTGMQQIIANTTDSESVGRFARDITRNPLFEPVEDTPTPEQLPQP